MGEDQVWKAKIDLWSLDWCGGQISGQFVSNLRQDGPSWQAGFQVVAARQPKLVKGLVIEPEDNLDGPDLWH